MYVCTYIRTRACTYVRMYIAKKDNEKKVKGIRALQGIMFHA